MNTLTCAELLAYPGQTLSDKAESHFAARGSSHTSQAERPLKRADGLGPRRAAETAARSSGRAEREHGPSFLGRAIDVRRFTGRDRVERVASYLRAYMPRTATWAEDDLYAYAARLVQTAQIIE